MRRFEIEPKYLLELAEPQLSIFWIFSSSQSAAKKYANKSKGNADEREGPTEKTSILSFDILNTIAIFFNFGHCIKKIDGNLTMGHLLCLEECICTTRSQEF